MSWPAIVVARFNYRNGLGALIPHRQKGGVRVTVNPSKFEPGDVVYFHQVLRKLIGSQSMTLNLKPPINGLDLRSMCTRCCTRIC
jgi:hypothetical protein